MKGAISDDIVLVMYSIAPSCVGEVEKYNNYVIIGIKL